MDKTGEIGIPSRFTEPLLALAAEKETSVEEIIEGALKEFLERRGKNA